MVASIKLSVAFSRRSAELFAKLGLSFGDDAFMQDYEFKCEKPPMIIDDVALTVEQYLENLYSAQIAEDGKRIQVQVQAVWHFKTQKELNFQDEVSQSLSPGDRVVVAAMALGPMSKNFDLSQLQPMFTEEDIEELRKRLRFGLNDRVLCQCGPRWLSGWIVGTAVADDEDLLPYLVKTDPLPGLPSATISVPRDLEEICVQEVCFDPNTQLDLVKCAASLVPETKRPKLRFGVGDKIVCRVRNSPQDGLEQWVPGVINEIWPALPGEEKWDMGDASGKYPDVVPYKINLASGWVFCHKDDHTLIRREGMQPVTRVRGISKRMELRQCADGSKERIDHVTERRKRMIVTSDSE